MVVEPTQLEGPQFEQFSEVLRAAFSPAELRRMLTFKLKKNLDNISLADNYEQIVFDLLGQAQRQGWVAHLLLAAREANPGNPLLLAFSQQFGLAPTDLPQRSELERMIVEANSVLDINLWRERLGQIEVQVCRVELRGKAAGTGFLLGPSVVMTNYHVVEPVIKALSGYTPADIRLRFDYKQLKDGNVLNPGVEYQLDAEQWLIDASPYSVVDSQPATHQQAMPADDELDYALLRVAGTPGKDAVGGSAGDPQAQRRGWIEASPTPHDFTASPALYIVQHPLGKPLKLALDTKAVIGLNANRTRVRYQTNTDRGSSGSPCFDQDWNLVALHHSGDPTKIKPEWNEGIPFDMILALLKKRNLLATLGTQPL
jgi:hypothetical protein